jgi:hypothetical protein
MGAITPETNITNIISVTILGAKYKPRAVHAARHDPQLNGLKFIFNLSG